jgi:uncharacterized membrane protein
LTVLQRNGARRKGVRTNTGPACRQSPSRFLFLLGFVARRSTRGTRVREEQAIPQVGQPLGVLHGRPPARDRQREAHNPPDVRQRLPDGEWGTVLVGREAEEAGMNAVVQPPNIVRWTLRLEGATALDRPVRSLEPVVERWFGGGTRGSVLRGEWLGHAVHPLLTDVVLGTWTSASVLDLVGGRHSSSSAQRLIGIGLVAVGPTAWTGWAEWSALGPRDKRVGLVHAVVNGAAIGMYAASWMARLRGRQSKGVRLALAGMTLTGLGGYLGGHLTEARKVASHHPAYDVTASS